MRSLKLYIFTFGLIISSLCLQKTLAQDIGIYSNPTPAKKPVTTPRKAPTPRKSPEPTEKPKRRITLTIISDPLECEIYLNDIYKGTTASLNGKLIIPDLDPNISYSLRIYKRGQGETLQPLALNPEQDQELKVSLSNKIAANDKPTNDNNKPDVIAVNTTKEPDKPINNTNKPTNKEPDKPVDNVDKPTNKEPDKPIENTVKSVNKEPDKIAGNIDKPTNKEPNKPIDNVDKPTNKEPDKPIENIAKPVNKEPDKPIENTTNTDTTKVATNITPNNSTTPTKPVIMPPQRDMVLIPSGEATIGSDIANPQDNFKPQYKVQIAAFYMDVYEVTNADFKLFCDATGRKYPVNPKWDANYFLTKPEHPVLNVSWDDANSYAAWVGKRLPTEEEWEYAARGQEALNWPWGRDFQTKLTNLDGIDDGFQYTAPPGSFPKGVTPSGLQDMVGNVWEWTSSSFKQYPGGNEDPRYSEGEKYRVIRGGGYNANIKNLRTVSLRYPGEINQHYEGTGFRCAKSQ